MNHFNKRTNELQPYVVSNRSIDLDDDWLILDWNESTSKIDAYLKDELHNLINRVALLINFALLFMSSNQNTITNLTCLFIINFLNLFLSPSKIGSFLFLWCSSKNSNPNEKLSFIFDRSLDDQHALYDSE